MSEVRHYKVNKYQSKVFKEKGVDARFNTQNEQPWKGQERHHANLTHGEKVFFASRASC